MISFSHYLLGIIFKGAVTQARVFQLLFHLEFSEDNILLDVKECVSQEK